MDIKITDQLVARLIAEQFPQWKELAITPVEPGGWDNRTFRLGDQMLVRMPSAACYAEQVAKEQRWLPLLAQNLSVAIPEPIAVGKPGHGYPWPWSVYNWITGNTVAATANPDLSQFAQQVARFLNELHRIDTTGGPPAGAHNFYRGGSVQVYNNQVKEALTILRDKIDAATAEKLWQAACATEWQHKPVWVHGDMSAGNLLVDAHGLCAVIDFGGLAIGDPACDLVLAWTLFEGKSRDIFKAELELDAETWLRAQAWALWKALAVAAGLTDPQNFESKRCWHIIEEIISEYKSNE